MPLGSNLNTLYLASNLVNQKYQPLENIQVNAGDTAICQAIIQNRITSFTNLGIRLDQLEFVGVETIDSYARMENGKDPPLVVISSNRSGWIKTGYENGKGILEGIDPPVSNFNDVNDRRALVAGPVPIYCPFRMSAAESNNRNVYIFVARDEYTVYQKKFEGTGIKIIGWQTLGEQKAVGFGASRYAAMEFFKYIFRLTGACGKIWMFDDNVVFIRGFPGFAVVEGQMVGNMTGLGFRGGTEASSAAVIMGLTAGAAPVPVAAGSHIPSPLLQQAVLWNVQLFTVNNYSFSPYFVTSAEDSSLTKFFGQIICRYYNNCEIFKGLPLPADFDNSLGVGLVNYMRRTLLTYLYNQRVLVPFTCPAVPAAADLAAVINAARTDPASPPRINNIQNLETNEQTYSKALEQILSVALGAGIHLPAGSFVFPVPVVTSKRAWVR